MKDAAAVPHEVPRAPAGTSARRFCTIDTRRYQGADMRFAAACTSGHHGVTARRWSVDDA